MAELEKETPLPAPSWLSLYKDSVLLLAFAIVFSLDQVSKALVRHNLLPGEAIPRDGPFRIVNSFNTGSAFGLFQDQTLFLILASVVGILVLLVVYRNHPFAGYPIRLSLGMQIGGAVGNLVDRVRDGRVTDFIDVGSWPVFNVADSAIVTGIILLIGIFVFSNKGDSHWSAGTQASVVEAPGNQWGRSLAGTGSMDSNGVRYWLAEDPEGLVTLADFPCMVCGSALRQILGGWVCRVCGAKKLAGERESW